MKKILTGLITSTLILISCSKENINDDLNQYSFDEVGNNKDSFNVNKDDLLNNEYKAVQDMGLFLFSEDAMKNNYDAVDEETESLSLFLDNQGDSATFASRSKNKCYVRISDCDGEKRFEGKYLFIGSQYTDSRSYCASQVEKKLDNRYSTLRKLKRKCGYVSSKFKVYPVLKTSRKIYKKAGKKRKKIGSFSQCIKTIKYKRCRARGTRVKNCKSTWCGL